MAPSRGSLYTIGKAIDNSHVVRERDPRTGRDIVWILFLAALVTAGVAAYAWPHLMARQTAIATEQASRERESVSSRRTASSAWKRRPSRISTAWSSSPIGNWVFGRRIPSAR